MSGPPFADLAACQRAFGRWRLVYNRKRPHESLDLAVPVERWRPSPRELPDNLPPVEVAPGCLARKVDQSGIISFRGRRFRLPRAFAGHPVGLRPTTTDGVLDAMFLCHRIAQVDLRDPTDQPVNHVPEHL